MQILVTNDDGIRAEGMALLVKELSRLGHAVNVISPRTNQTSKSHSITYRHPIDVEEVPLPGAKRAFAVDGTPADCVRVSGALLPNAPDLVVSGVNHGLNVGTDAYRSGTIGAAREAAFTGYPALALSAMEGADIPFMLLTHLPTVLDMALTVRDGFLSVNFPLGLGRERTVVAAGGQPYNETAEIEEGRLGEGRLRVRIRRSALRGSQALPPDLTVVLGGKVAVSALSREVGTPSLREPGRMERTTQENAS